MNRRLRIALALLYIVAVGSALFGIAYVVTPGIMPYHERFLGVTHAQLEPRVATLLLAVLRVAGSCFIALAATVVFLAHFGLARRERWAWWAILVASSTVMLPLIAVSLRIGTYTPWWAVAILQALAAVALVLGWPSRRAA